MSSVKTRIERLEVRAGQVVPQEPPIDLEDLDAFLRNYYAMLQAMPAYYEKMRQQTLRSLADHEWIVQQRSGMARDSVEDQVLRYRRDMAIQDAIVALIDAELTGVGFEAALAAFEAADDMPCFKPPPWIFSLCKPPGDKTTPGYGAAARYIDDFWETFWYGSVKSRAIPAKGDDK
jgi:hypothetical protein